MSGVCCSAKTTIKQFKYETGAKSLLSQYIMCLFLYRRQGLAVSSLGTFFFIRHPMESLLCSVDCVESKIKMSKGSILCFDQKKRKLSSSYFLRLLTSLLKYIYSMLLNYILFIEKIELITHLYSVFIRRNFPVQIKQNKWILYVSDKSQ